MPRSLPPAPTSSSVGRRPTRSGTIDLGAARRVGADWATGLGRSLVVAPHPDDEAIGCGGLIALLRRHAVPVSVVLVSDGVMSHPASRVFSPPMRRALRIAEMARSLDVLGVGRERFFQLGYADGDVPGTGSACFDEAASRLLAVIVDAGARVLIVPWRRDPHRDHRAANEIARAANARLPVPARLLEYLVWTPERGDAAEWPRPEEARIWRLDISTVVEQKIQAVRRHRSQLGAVIHDDPCGFTLPADMLARCAAPEETFLEVVAHESNAGPAA